MAVARFQGLAHESEIDVAIAKPQEMILRNMVFDAKVVKQQLRTSLLNILMSSAPPYSLVEDNIKSSMEKRAPRRVRYANIPYYTVFGVVPRSFSINHFPGCRPHTAL